jgi:hypothetical protein
LRICVEVKQQTSKDIHYKTITNDDEEIEIAPVRLHNQITLTVKR